MLQAALNYIERGWRVFPVSGKIPVTKRGVLDASRDLQMAQSWWGNTPYGIALATGDGLVVLDIDPKSNGPDSLAELESKYGHLPATYSVVTPSGGQHYYFHSTDDIRNSAGRRGPGIDIRGTNGYVVAPPSPGYERDLGSPDTLAEFPFWLIPQKRAFSEAVEGPIPSGQRNAELIRIAGVMRRHPTFTYEAILAALLEVNAARCVPPLSEDEVEHIAKSVMRYKPENVNSYSAGRREGSAFSGRLVGRDSPNGNGFPEAGTFQRRHKRNHLRVGAWYLRGGR